MTSAAAKLAVAACLFFGLDATAVTPRHVPVTVPVAETDSVDTLPERLPISVKGGADPVLVEKEIRLDDGRMIAVPVDTVDIMPGHFAEAEPPMLPAAMDSTALTVAEAQPDEWVRREVEFNPDPTRAVWLSALFPGLGQVYNRRYWKLPIIVGGYLGLAYATDWNNRMLSDYTRAYADLTDKDDSTNSYMDFFAPTVSENDLDRSWLENTFRSRKNYFRRNRDLCIICMVGVYLLAMVDAYVDAALSHFDISPDLSMDVAPALIQDGRNRLPSVGLLWALTF